MGGAYDSLPFVRREIYFGKSLLPVDGEYKPWTADMVGAAASDHTHTKASISLGNVDNTADAEKNVKYATSANYANSCGTANYMVWSNASGVPEN